MCFLNGFWGDRSVRVRTGRVQKNQKVLGKKEYLMSIIVLGKEVMGRYVKEWRGKETDFLYIYILGLSVHEI